LRTTPKSRNINNTDTTTSGSIFPKTSVKLASSLYLRSTDMLNPVQVFKYSKELPKLKNYKYLEFRSYKK
jgi:hypothetical protein